MTSLMHVKEPLTLDLNCKKINLKKKCMVNYLNILDFWDVIKYSYIPQYDSNNLTLTQKVK
jgi:hypothetical protein